MVRRSNTPSQVTIPDLSEYGVDAPRLDAAELAELHALIASPSWHVILRTRAHLQTQYGKLLVRGEPSNDARRARDPYSFDMGVYRGFELLVATLAQMGRGEPIPDLTTHDPAFGAPAGHEMQDDIL